MVDLQGAKMRVGDVPERPLAAGDRLRLALAPAHAHEVPLPYAPTLEDFVLPQTEDIVAACRWMVRY